MLTREPQLKAPASKESSISSGGLSAGGLAGGLEEGSVQTQFPSPGEVRALFMAALRSPLLEDDDGTLISYVLGGLGNRPDIFLKSFSVS